MIETPQPPVIVVVPNTPVPDTGPTGPGPLTFTFITADSVQVNYPAATDPLGIAGYEYALT